MRTNKFPLTLAPVLLLVLLVVSSTAGAQGTPSWTPVGPVDRSGHTAVLATSRGVHAHQTMIVFGGNVRGSQQNLNDVWWLHGSSASALVWTQASPSGTTPAPRLRHSAVYDSASDNMIVFGGGLGGTSPCVNDVWVLSNADGSGLGAPAWTQLSPSGAAPAPRNQHGAAYDPTTNSMIIYGGNDCFQGFYGDVWVLSHANGKGGRPTWTQFSPAGGGPGAREVSNSVTYDATNNVLMVFGGVDQSGVFHNDTCVLSHANGQGGTPTWAQLAPSGSLPAARSDNSATYDPVNNRLTIFGGNNGSGLFGDAWVLTNANGLGGSPSWMQLAVPAGFAPAARSLHTGVYDASTNRLTIFGGVIDDACCNANDVWVLNDANGL